MAGCPALESGSRLCRFTERPRDPKLHDPDAAERYVGIMIGPDCALQCPLTAPVIRALFMKSKATALASKTQPSARKQSLYARKNASRRTAPPTAPIALMLAEYESLPCEKKKAADCCTRC